MYRILRLEPPALYQTAVEMLVYTKFGHGHVEKDLFGLVSKTFPLSLFEEDSGT
jgi:hypothetical protein